MAVRLISGSWAQKRLTPNFRHGVRRVHEKFLFRPREHVMAVRFISASWVQERLFLLSRDDVRRVHEKISTSPIRTRYYLIHFDLLRRKTFDSYFLEMICIKFMKNFYLSDWNNLIAVRLISGSWVKKRLIPNLRHDVRWAREKFLPRQFERGVMALRLIPACLSQKTFDSYFLDMIGDELMNYFCLSDWSNLKAVRLISRSWGQRRSIRTF